MQSNQINNFLAKCWADLNFKQQLLFDQAAGSKAEDVEIPAGFTVCLVEHTGKVINYVLSPNPNAELSHSELKAVAGGKLTTKDLIKIDFLF